MFWLVGSKKAAEVVRSTFSGMTSTCRARIRGMKIVVTNAASQNNRRRVKRCGFTTIDAMKSIALNDRNTRAISSSPAIGAGVMVIPPESAGGTTANAPKGVEIKIR